MNKENAGALLADLWISVKERLPEKSGLYIVYAPSADPASPRIHAVWYECDERGEGYKKGWSLCDPWAKAATHWMPLPDPPKEG